MRLDLFLVASRLIKRRSLAQEFCEKGLLRVNGNVVKSSKDLKPGDLIEIIRRSEKTEVRVLKLPLLKQVSRSEAPSLFEIVNVEKIEDTE